MTMAEQRYCYSCGAQIKPEMAFCSKCGAELKGGHAAGKNGKAVAKERKKHAFLPVIITLSVLLIAAIMALVVVFRFVLPGMRYEQAETFLRAGQYEEARDLFDKIRFYKDSAEKSDVLGLYLDAEKQLKKGDYAAASKTADKMEKTADGEELAKEIRLYLEAQECFDASEYEQAEALFNSIGIADSKKRAQQAADCYEVVANSAAPAVESADVVAPAAEPADERPVDEATSVTTDEGKVFRIYCINELYQRIIKNYPGYIDLGNNQGQIGDVQVQWQIESDYYHEHLADDLSKQMDRSLDDRIDLFMCEPDYSLRYTDSDITIPLADLGISDAEFSEQYAYTKDLVCDSHGIRKGSFRTASIGGMIYNREIAREVLGTDDPAEVQRYVEDWTSFQSTAGLMASRGYQMMSTPADLYKPFAAGAKQPWVSNGRVSVPAEIKQWADTARAMVSAGQTNDTYMWGDVWYGGFYPEGKVFCYFGPTWICEYCTCKDDSSSVAASGGWAMTKGPQGFFWGGDGLFAAAGTDNPELCGSIIRFMTIDYYSMDEASRGDLGDHMNNRALEQYRSADSTYASSVLGGQNPLAVLDAAADEISPNYFTAYDYDLDTLFQSAMSDYISGRVSYNEALTAFYQEVKWKFPELSY